MLCSLSLSTVQVKFETPVSIAENPKINEWLTLTEREMRVTLATHLARAVEGIAEFNKPSFEVEAFLKWADSCEVGNN